MKTRTSILLIAAVAFAMTSCQKSTPIDSTSVDAADDAAFSEVLFDDVFASLEIATAYAESDLKSATVIDSCPVVTVTFPTQEAWPRNIVIDYGTGCTGLDDIIRSGKINITLTGPRRTVGSQRTVTFEDYYFNGVKIEGTNMVENLGPNNDGNVVFAVSLTNGKVTFPDDTYIERSFQREREYIAGYDTWTPWDDECLITGSATGVNLDGLTYTHTIINALDWKAACRFIVAGTIRFEVEGVEPFDLDYGSGDCDAFATLSRGDETKVITLRVRHPRLLLAD